MKTQRNILIAFVLNLSFAVFEFIGGAITGSVAIASDAVHDMGDAVSIGLSYILERKSTKVPDEQYTYGYGRYSVIGSFITTVMLLFGAAVMIGHSVGRIIRPTPIHYDGMIVFAVLGVCVNLCAAVITHGGDSLNQRAVNLHMLEDVLGWVVVLVGAVVMRFTDFAVLDPILSIGVSAFIIANALGNLRETVGIFLEKVPSGIDIAEIAEHLKELDGVMDVHHIHLWSMDGQSNYATMHVVTDGEAHEIKSKIRKELREHGIGHVTIETEKENESCCEKVCRIERHSCSHHHHHHCGRSR